MNVILNITMVVLTLAVFVATILMFMGVFRLYNAIKNDNKTFRNKAIENGVCNWQRKPMLDDQSYSTQCGKEFFDATETGEPVTDWVDYCCYCGKKVKVIKK